MKKVDRELPSTNTSSEAEELRTGQAYRIDKFKVPKPARAEFIQKARIPHEFFKTQPGFIQDFVFEQQVAPVSLILSRWPYGRAPTRWLLPGRPQ